MDNWTNAKWCDVANLILGAFLFFSPWIFGFDAGKVSQNAYIAGIAGADDVTIAEIIGTGATVDELAEAQAWLANDEPLLNAGKPLATGRIRELVDILSELEPSEDEETGPTVSQE